VGKGKREEGEEGKGGGQRKSAGALTITHCPSRSPSTLSKLPKRAVRAEGSEHRSGTVFALLPSLLTGRGGWRERW
jgi:hypothetical protein